MKIICRTCGSAIAPADVNLAGDVAVCRACQELIPLTSNRVLVEMENRVDRPARTRLEFVANPDSVGLIIPPGNNPVWRTVPAAIAVVLDVIAVVIVLAALVPRTSVDVSVVGACFFVTLAMTATFVALFFARGEFTLAINRRECTAIWHLYRWSHTRQIRTAEITDVIEQVIYAVSGRPRYAVLLKHPARSILFGGTMTNAERRWIVDELRRFLRLEQPVAEPAAT